MFCFVKCFTLNDLDQAVQILLLRNLFPGRIKIKDKFWSTLSFGTHHTAGTEYFIHQMKFRKNFGRFSCFVFCCCDKTLSKPMWGGKGFYLAYRLQSII